ncbi:unnamed protein product [Ilex paraguariensis]|uniref:Cytochrome b561 domain-containing protein n=1 Tax=Ilex paraguariensis TaxID=185542 RepID=A0ABC8TKE2_9AQUA
MAPKSRQSFQLSALPVAMFAHLVAIAVMALLLVWLLHFRDGAPIVNGDWVYLNSRGSYNGIQDCTSNKKVFKFHNELGIPDMYTLHSWLGLSTICLFGLQLLFAFFAFLFPGAEWSTRARLAPWHVFFGIVIFFMAILSAETGLVEKFIFLKLQRGQEALIVNFTGLLILLFGISVGLTVLLPQRY